ncbi:STAS domain-containing protein [Mycobacterium seoulense]|uniref:Anti-sigma factor antagonist n=1 Tax=Mycobacterium seoulense TaxID=386911 RepID=A0A7I7P4B7_9MYCO|nr:STAS domain-containing protein [Mycobacterium seoulense]MCV7438496.1 STAS domain-containing protein [Mycobacterium seoulense]BBY03549.1 anti-sigma factor antagonist [Mycobacterium seoulense]
MGEQTGDPIDPTAFAVGKQQVDQAVVLTVSGEVDMLSSPHLAEAIQTALGTKPAALIVDLSKVDFLASAGMTVLVTAQAEAEPPTRFAVVANGSATSRPIKLMGIDSVLALYSTLDDALSGVAAG